MSPDPLSGGVWSGHETTSGLEVRGEEPGSDRGGAREMRREAVSCIQRR